VLSKDPLSLQTIDCWGLRMGRERMIEAVDYLVENDYLVPAGRKVTVLGNDMLFLPSQKSIDHYHRELASTRVRPRTACEIPKWSFAQLSVASAPVDVFDMSRVHKSWDRAAEKMKDWEEVVE